jgi:hypothetical protein
MAKGISDLTVEPSEMAEAWRTARRQLVASGHGSPTDRGAADSYYRRAPVPHCYIGEFGEKRIEAENMTTEQIKAYNNAYDANEAAMNWKDWN